MKCRQIEIYNRKTNRFDKIEVSSVFNLAVVSGETFPQYKKIGYYGINIGVAIPFKNKKEGELFFKKYWDPVFNEKGELNIFLIGDDGEKVPLVVREGKEYDPAYESICLFGYVVPDIIAEDPMPLIKNKEKYTLGSIFAELRNKMNF